MTTSDLERLANPVWYALTANHRCLGTVSGRACRYDSDVAPFGGVREISIEAVSELASLLAQGESLWVVAEELPQAPELVHTSSLECLQMWMPADIKAPEPVHTIEHLSCENATEMVSLTGIAFPGFFRSRTCAMGRYFGIRSPEGALISMAGERLIPEGLPEISGVCTHPAHRAKGLAAALVWRVIENARQRGGQPWLTVTSTNSNAVALYRRLGFETIREMTLRQVTRL